MKAPGAGHLIPLPYGRFRAFLQDPLAFQLSARERFGDVFRFRIGPLLIHFLYHPEFVHHVLVEHQKNYLRGWQYHRLRKLFGPNLVVSEGDIWRRHRRMAQPAFHRQRMAGYAEVMVDATASMLAGWRDMDSKAGTVDIGRAMTRLTLAIASRTLFDRDVSQEADAVGQAFSTVGNYLELQFNHPFTTPPNWMPTPTSLKFKRAARVLNAIVLELIRQRRSDNSDRGDLLSMLIAARDEDTSGGMTDDELRSEVLTFLLASHETTATALTWTWYLLASHPSTQQAVRDEIDSVVGGRPPAVEDLPSLRLTRQVLEESMRLFPPIWAIPRQASSDDEIGGYRIPAGSTVVVSPYVTHRHPAVWEEPDKFDPARFSAENARLHPKGSFFPFLSGPHQCIGQDFAMLEMQFVLAIVLQSFNVEIRPEQEIEPTASIVLRPSCPIRLMAKRRLSAPHRQSSTD